MIILAVDQARNGAWAAFDLEKKALLEYDVFTFDSRKYPFPTAVLEIEKLIGGVIRRIGVGAVFFEDIQLRKNPQSFKRLAQLQGVLVNLCEKNKYPYGIVPPSTWQSYCNARPRTKKEIGGKDAQKRTKRPTKILSIDAVNRMYGILTENDNLADAIMIGHYVVNNIEEFGIAIK